MKKIIFIVAVAALLWACGTQRSATPAPTPSQVWVVASETANCTGVAPQRCLLVKPEGAVEWQFHYGGIEGFDYEPGFEYVISVDKQKVENPPMDASSIRYVLKEVLSKERKTSAGIPDTGHMFQ